jgi:hypothetical protein
MPHRTTKHSFVKANGCPCSKLTPEDRKRTPETCRVAKIQKLSKVTSSWLLIDIKKSRLFKVQLPAFKHRNTKTEHEISHDEDVTRRSVTLRTGKQAATRWINPLTPELNSPRKAACLEFTGDFSF